jgi:hypothetical protein
LVDRPEGGRAPARPGTDAVADDDEHDEHSAMAIEAIADLADDDQNPDEADPTSGLERMIG